MQAVDYAFCNIPDYLERLAAAGVGAVGRYAPYQGDGGKGLTPAEYERIKASGLQMWLYFQIYGTESRLGFDEGVRQARIALDAHQLVPELPEGIAFYFASDYDVTDVGAQVEHFHGINAVLPVERIGVYGDAQLLEALTALGLVTYTCLAGASSWSAGARPATLTMEQFPSTDFLGMRVDPVSIYAEDFGQGGNQMDKALRRSIWSGREESNLADAERDANVTFRIQKYSEEQEGLASQLFSLAGAFKDVVAQVNAAFPSNVLNLDDALDRIAAIEGKLAKVQEAFNG